MKYTSLLLKICIGNLLLALAVNLLIIPNQLMSGGATGLVLILTHYTGLEFAMLTAVVNVVTFVIGYLVLGKKFASTTLVSTLVYPLMVQLTGMIHLHVTDEPVVAAILAGMIMGMGLGLVIGSGASTGGMDIPIIIANRKLGISVSAGMYVMDSLLLLGQMTFNDMQNLIPGLILIVFTTLTINQVMLAGKSACQVFVVSQKQEEIRQAIISKLDRGATLVHIQTGYLQQETSGVLSVVSNRDLHHLQKTILEIDPLAFMTVTKIQEVNGRGFSLDKHLGDA